MARDISAQLAKQLKVQIGHILESVAYDWVENTSTQLKQQVLECIKKFQQREKSIWDKLGQGVDTKDRRGWSKTFSIGGGKNKVLNSQLHKFKNRTEEMKNYTGYIIMFDGMFITGRNRLLRKGASRGVKYWTKTKGVKDGYALPLANVARGYGQNVYTGKIRKPFRGKSFEKGKNENVDIWKKVNLSISIFADSEHAFLVDNPLNRTRTRKNKEGKPEPYLPQGTGWFRMYAQEVARAWMVSVILPIMRDIEHLNIKERRGSQSNYSAVSIKNNEADKLEAKDILSGELLGEVQKGEPQITNTDEKYTLRRTSMQNAQLNLKKGAVDIKIPIILTSKEFHSKYKRQSYKWY